MRAKEKKQKYDTLLFDVDDTLLDFKGCEGPALKQAMAMHGLSLSKEEEALYHQINEKLWKNLGKDGMTINKIMARRFDLFLDYLGKEGDGQAINRDFLISTGDFIRYEPEAKKILEKIKGHYRLAIVTNGVRLSQESKFKETGLDQWFDYVFVTDQVGAYKPEKAFFDYVEKAMGGLNKEKTLIIGDGLESDILGGQKYGIDTCWYNKKYRKKKEGICPTYEISQLTQLMEHLNG